MSAPYCPACDCEGHTPMCPVRLRQPLGTGLDSAAILQVVQGYARDSGTGVVASNEDGAVVLRLGTRVERHRTPEQAITGLSTFLPAGHS